MYIKQTRIVSKKFRCIMRRTQNIQQYYIIVKMLPIEVFIFLFMGSSIVLSEVNQNQLEIINQYIQIYDTQNVYIKDITIHNSKHCSIYNMYGDCQTKLLKEHTIDIFYTTTSCKFADWIIHYIYDFVKSSPVFYRQEFQSHYHNIYETVFHPLFKESLCTLIFNINKYIERLIRILNNFLCENTYYTYYNDITVLKSLMSLRIKLKFLSAYADTKNKPMTRKSDSAVIRNILEDMNALQSFLSMNCKDLPASKRNSTFYGYWINIDNMLVNVSDIDDFLLNILPLNLEYYSFKCSVSQIFLENVANVSSNNHISLDIAHAMVKITDTENMTIKDILVRLKKSYAIDLIYLYLESVSITIMKLIYKKIYDMYETQQRCTPKIINNIQKINEKISNDSMNLPKYLVDGFALLMDVENHELDLRETLKEFNDKSLNGIELGEWNESLLGQKNFEIFKKKTNSKSNKITVRNLVLNKSQLNPKLDIPTYLEEFTTRILNNFDELKCFNQNFNFLRSENSRYFVPLIDNKKAHFPIEEGNYKSDAICDFVVISYTICYQVITYINEDIDKKNTSASKDVIFDRARKAINSIKDYFFVLISENKKNIAFLKMAYNVVIILTNIKVTSIQFKNYYKLKRILNVIMTELNKYGISNCTSPKQNFLIFNNINFIDFGISKMIEKFMSAVIESSPNNFDSGNLFFSSIKLSQSEDYSYLDIEYLYNRFILKSDVFKLYAYNITILWKGKYENIYSIYKDLMNLTMNPLHLYAFYDIYFTFYVVVVYYEIRHIIQKKQYEPVKKRFAKILDNLIVFDHIYFPSKLHNLIIEIKMLLKLPSTLNNCTPKVYMTEILKIGEKIEHQIRSFNIFFAKLTFSASIKIGLHIIRLFSKDVLTIINSELDSNVKEFNAYFSKFKH